VYCLCPLFFLSKQFSLTVFKLSIQIMMYKLLSGLLLSSFILPAFASPIKLYVSPGGKSATFTQSSPGSLWGAKEKVRHLNGSMKGDIIIYLLNGEYVLDSTFTLRSKDSGKNGYNIIYAAAKGAKPVLSGGWTLNGWTIHDQARNIYKTQVKSDLQTRQLFVNGKRAQRARGEEKPKGFIKKDNGYLYPRDGLYSTMKNWKNISDIEIVGNTEWKTFRVPVAAINDTLIILQKQAWEATAFEKFGLRLPHFIENAYELLDEEGEWYQDYKAGYIYYKPRKNENMDTVNTIIGKQEILISGRGTPEEPVQNIQFQGITFAYTTWLGPKNPWGLIINQASHYKIGDKKVKIPAAINFTNSSDIVFQDNIFTHLGASAIEFAYGCSNNTIRNNRFEDISAAAVEIGGILDEDHHPADSSRIVTNNKVINNYITRIGVEYFSAVAVFVGYTSNTLIEHNEIHDVPYTGISLGWGWGKTDLKGSTVTKNNKIQYNHIYNYMNKLKDGGGIYILGAQPGLLINNNYIHDSYEMHAGIYLDNGTRFVTAENNVVEKMFSNWAFVQLHVGIFATDNILRNNYSDTEKALIAEGNTMLNNIVITDKKWPDEAKRIIKEAGLIR